METLSTLYASQMPLYGHNYRIPDDPVRWARFKNYLELLPQHAPPARLTMSSLATSGRYNPARPGARTSTYGRRTSASTSPGTVT